MTLERAYRRASQQARQRRQFTYVVWSAEEDDAPGQHYHYASELDCDTFFAGCEVLVCFGPDGALESSI